MHSRFSGFIVFVLADLPVHEGEDLPLHLDDLVEAVLHVCLVLGVYELEAGLPQQLRRGEPHDVHHPMVNKGEFSI